MRFQWTLILGLVFAVVIAIFAVINVAPVEVNLLFDVVQLPLILLILGCTLIGGLIVGFYGIYRQYRLQRQVKQLQAQVAQLGEVPANNIEATEDVSFDTMYDKSDDPSASSFSERK